jgi:hypothetical protein
MSHYTSVVEMLDGVISKCQEEFKEANETVSFNGFIDNYDMNNLMKSNNKAQAALKVRAIILTALEEDRVNISHITGLWMNDAIRSGNYSVAHFYENVIKALNPTNPTIND